MNTYFDVESVMFMYVIHTVPIMSSEELNTAFADSFNPPEATQSLPGQMGTPNSWGAIRQQGGGGGEGAWRKEKDRPAAYS